MVDELMVKQNQKYIKKQSMKKIETYIYLILVGLTVLCGCTKDVYHADPIPLKYIRAMYKGEDMVLPESRINGIVITDIDNGNHLPGYIIVQSGNYGMALELSNAGDFKLGDSVVANVSGKLLTRYNGLLQVRGIDPENVRKVSSGKTVSTRAVGVSTLYNNRDKYENTLVKVLGDITPSPGATETFEGNKQLEELGFKVSLFTTAEASFANDRLPANASFQGVILGNEDNGIEIRMRNIADMENASGKVYPGFPESFETARAYSNPAYFMDFPSGKWKLNIASIQNQTTDRVSSGAYAIRFNFNNSVAAYAQMEFDAPLGASKVTVYYGRWGGDPGSTWRLEYSTDQGATWKQMGEHVTDAGPVAKLKTFMMDIHVPVRFRIHKLALGTSTTTISNGRLSIDDFAVYQPY